MNRLTTIASWAVIGASIIGSYALGPGPKAATTARPLVTSGNGVLPSTGARRTNFETIQASTPVAADIYSRDVPPAPAAPATAPAPAPRFAVAVQPWTPPPGYAIISVPVYRQAMVLDCETGALRMGLATSGHYYSDAALYALENPDTRAPIMGPNKTVLQWGDPYTNFVGQVNGSDTAATRHRPATACTGR